MASEMETLRGTSNTPGMFTPAATRAYACAVIVETS